MKRKDIIEKLLSEGFSEKTLSRMGDKELTVLAKTVLKEAVMIDAGNVKDIEDAKKLGKTIETYEEKSEEGDEVENEEWSHVQKENEVESWVLNLAEEKFSNFTKKSEIMEIISSKVKETSTPMPATKANKGHNGVPEFMTYDSIMSSSTKEKEKETETPVRERPVREKPTEKPKTDDPFSPKPGPNHAPKALAEKKRIKNGI
jgi:hypothetical protein